MEQRESLFRMKVVEEEVVLAINDSISVTCSDHSMWCLRDHRSTTC